MLFNKFSNIILLVTIMLFSTVQGNAVEINRYIQSGADDVEERARGRVSSSSGDLEMVYDSGDQTIGLRFVNLDIPQGAKITSAYLQFTADETDSGTTNLNIYGELTENAPAFSKSRRDVTSRTKTSASALWSVPTWGRTKVSTPAQRTPELKEVVQEIVNLGGWQNSNSMVFIINGTGKRVADSYEGGKKRAPKLYISYEIDNDNNNNEEIIDNGDTPIMVGAVDVSVNQRDDDAEESSNGSVSTHSSDLELVRDGSNQTVGIRFRGVNIPKDATIENAYLQFTVDERDSEATNLNIYAQKSASAEIFKRKKFNISSREKSQASVVWSVPAWKNKLESAKKQTTPNLKALVQELIELDGWSANSDVAFLITGTGKRVADSYEGGADRATKLHIEFTVGGNDNDDNSTDNGGGDDNNNTDGGDDNNSTDGGTDNNNDNSGDGGDNDNTDNGNGGENNGTVVSRTLDVSLNSGSDDVEEADDGEMYIDSSDLELIHDWSDQTVGLRFTNLSIPQGATITSATIQFNTDEVDSTQTTALNIYAQKSNNASRFLSTNYNVSSRAKTTASIVWDVPVWSSLNEHGLSQKTPELKEVVQEVVNLNGWTKSSALAFIINGTGKRVADSFEGGAEKAPKLHIEYSYQKDSVVVDPTVTTFVEDSHANILNPDRGLYSADYNLAESTDYNIFADPQAEGYRLVYAPINLYDYINTTTLSDSLLNTINGHLVEAEEKGVKLILRLKYRKDASSSYQDPALATILGHIEQLKDTLQNHKEIISVVQVGTLGAWGEWNRFTGEFADSDSNYRANRRAVVEKLIEIFPNKYVQIRTPMHKELLYGTSAEYKDEGVEGKITTEIAYSNDIRAKIGHHNDCFLVDETNYGTYGSNVNFWKDYISDDGKYAPVGGETCGIDSSRDEYLSDCDNAVAEMKHLKYSYLNNVYHPDVLNKWKEQGCYDEIKENLGYRLVATQLEATKSSDNSSLNVALKIENKGFASPYIPSTVNWVLKNSDQSYSFNQPTIDMRQFYASESKDINSVLPLEGVESGEYCLYLQIGDGFSAIRLSNSQNSEGVDIWDTGLKMNRLKCGIEL